MMTLSDLRQHRINTVKDLHWLGIRLTAVYRQGRLQGFTASMNLENTHERAQRRKHH